MPQYRSANLARSAKLDAAADELYEDGARAKGNGDRYILSNVFAAVLFFASACGPRRCLEARTRPM
jgi:hypothetical protein